MRQRGDLGNSASSQSSSKHSVNSTGGDGKPCSERTYPLHQGRNLGLPRRAPGLRRRPPLLLKAARLPPARGTAGLQHRPALPRRLWRSRCFQKRSAGRRSAAPHRPAHHNGQERSDGFGAPKERRRLLLLRKGAVALQGLRETETTEARVRRGKG